MPGLQLTFYHCRTNSSKLYTFDEHCNNVLPVTNDFETKINGTQRMDFKENISNYSYCYFTSPFSLCLLLNFTNKVKFRGYLIIFLYLFIICLSVSERILMCVKSRILWTYGVKTKSDVFIVFAFFEW